jgi:integrase/recombinase XerD
VLKRVCSARVSSSAQFSDSTAILRKRQGKRNSASRRLPVFLRPAEARALLLAAPTARDRLIIQLGLNTGLRVSEIVKLLVEDVDLVGGELLVRAGKGDKDRMVPLPSHLLRELEAWVGTRSTGPVFQRARADVPRASRTSARAPWS